MEYYSLPQTNLKVSKVALGCMRIASKTPEEVENLVLESLKAGINFFDHADIYGGGSCEELFGKAAKLNTSNREKFFIQSKCGIVPGVMYDFSKEHIINSVDGILKRLGTDYLDALLLHRPDALMEPEVVADAFDTLEKSGKVRNFGVSNMNPMQIQLLQKYVKQPICANQLQLSITNSNMISQGMEVNMTSDGAVNRDGAVLDFCRLNNITIQTWSPFQYGFFEGVFIGNDKFPELNKVIDELAQKYNVTPTTIVTAWILRHPANMQMIAGTTNAERLKQIAQASDIEISREEWYKLYLSAGHILP